jgi:hypothetical protein
MRTQPEGCDSPKGGCAQCLCWTDRILMAPLIIADLSLSSTGNLADAENFLVLPVRQVHNVALWHAHLELSNREKCWTG